MMTDGRPGDEQENSSFGLNSARRRVQGRCMAEPRCINFGGALVDEAVSRQVLRVLKPGAIEAALQSGREQSQQQDQVVRALELELKAARYAADRAGSQYDAADPKNRLVADELERRWNAALERVAELEARIAKERCQRAVAELPSADQLARLAKDLEQVWDDPQTDVLWVAGIPSRIEMIDWR